MSLELDFVSSNQPLILGRSELWKRISELLNTQQPRHERLWNYYRNQMLPRTISRDEQGADRPYRQAQEWGLPTRVTGQNAVSGVGFAQAGIARKEIVIENDIAWRIDTAVDYLFGSQINIKSKAPKAARAKQIEMILATVFEHNGGRAMLQHLATLGAVHGFVDVLVRFDPATPAEQPLVQSDELASDAAPASTGDVIADNDASLPPLAESASRAASVDTEPLLDEQPADSKTRSLPSFDALVRVARMIRLEIVEPARALPVLGDNDWRQVRAYVQVYQTLRTQSAPAARRNGFLARLGSTAGRLFGAEINTQKVTFSQIITADAWQRWEDDRLIESGGNSLGEIPLVHIQNLPLPFEYSGVSDVEALLPLQDELNTRLSDRANRITLQSFKMYLGKGIEGFTELPIAPGQMWMTDNTDADIIEFGGDASCPSEDQHIQELREAMDKISAVTPIAAGILKDRIGNLTSATALRVTLTALLSRTERKRGSYGQAIARICELALAWLDVAGVFPNTPQERQIEIEWPDLLAVFDQSEPKI